MQNLFIMYANIVDKYETVDALLVGLITYTSVKRPNFILPTGYTVIVLP